MKKISKNDFYNIINDNSLKLYKDVWHYSFNNSLIKPNYFYHKIKNNIWVYTSPLDQWSPALCYTNFEEENIYVYNSILEKNINYSEVNKLFWFLKISSFKEYLERRDLLSSKPRKHFPTSYTYKNILSKIDFKFEYIDFDVNFFCETFDKIKRENYMDGMGVCALINSQISKKWLKMGLIYFEGEIVSIGLFIDDEKSTSLFNITSSRSRFSFGSLLCVETIKYIASKHYFSFDCGISGKYGCYKDKIFIDSYDVNLSDSTLNNVNDNLYMRIWSKILKMI